MKTPTHPKNSPLSGFRAKSAYDPHPRLTFATTGESLTHQAHKRECDVNNIMAKFEKTGVLEHRNTYQGEYADFTNAPMDYQESLNQVLEAEEMFSSLPSKIRARFGNSPAAFLDFVDNPESGPEMVKMGLAVQQPEDVFEEPKKTTEITKKVSEETPNA